MVERKNRSNMQAVKATIHGHDLPMHLYAEATKTAVYAHNKISHSAFGNKTLEKMFTSENPEVGRLNIFACPIFILLEFLL